MPVSLDTGKMMGYNVEKTEGTMVMQAVFFDLDGTLTDSGEGITKCAQLALEHFGIHVEDRSALRVFVGPPLRESFPRFGVPEDRVEEAVERFRSRYNTVGKFENEPYEGIYQVLETLKAEGKRLFVATSKPETTAMEVLEKFRLSGYFERICGATMDGLRDSKESVIRYLLEQTGGDPKEAIMVGDTAYDVEGAKVFGIDTIGVTWGFGSRASLIEAGAVAVVDTMEGLLNALR